MSTAECPGRRLVALDFDHSVIEDNSDIVVQQLAPGGKIPHQIKQLYKEDGWTDFMAAIFRYLHDVGVKKTAIDECMRKIPLIDGMQNLFKYFNDNNYDVIIISDSNSYFIDLILNHYKLDSVVDKVFTNPAKFNDEGCLTIKQYHEQDWCTLSSKNLCKGHILDEYIAAKGRDGISYSRVSFVGDGSNDLCPMLRLRSQDFAFVRKEFHLEKIMSTDSAQDMKAKVIMWNNGEDILEALKS